MHQIYQIYFFTKYLYLKNGNQHSICEFYKSLWPLHNCRYYLHQEVDSSKINKFKRKTQVNSFEFLSKKLQSFLENVVANLLY